MKKAAFGIDKRPVLVYFIWVMWFKVQRSRWPIKAASLIGKETNERPTSNVE